MTLLNNKHIFIVEDNIKNQIVFNMALIRHGAYAIFERWGRDTLSQLRITSNIDLIVLDLMLTEDISGFDIFDQIRALPKFDAVPIIAVSAMDAAVAIPQTRERGFSGFIAKPIDTRLFPKQVAAIISGEQIWNTSANLIA